MCGQGGSSINVMVTGDVAPVPKARNRYLPRLLGALHHGKLSCMTYGTGRVRQSMADRMVRRQERLLEQREGRPWAIRQLRDQRAGCPY